MFEQAVEASRGLSPGTFTKAYASLSNFTAAQFEDMQAAAEYLQITHGTSQWRKGWPGQANTQHLVISCDPESLATHLEVACAITCG